jgi:hypothetical protein
MNDDYYSYIYFKFCNVKDCWKLLTDTYISCKGSTWERRTTRRHFVLPSHSKDDKEFPRHPTNVSYITYAPYTLS